MMMHKEYEKRENILMNILIPEILSKKLEINVTALI